MGCGEGVLVRELVRVVPFVVGLDRDRPSLQSAQSHGAVGSSFVAGDMLASPFPSATFDMVTSVASLHHVDAVAGLEEMARLLAPGGVLVVIGLARGRYPTDLPIEIAAFAATRCPPMAKGAVGDDSAEDVAPRDDLRWDAQGGRQGSSRRSLPASPVVALLPRVGQTARWPDLQATS